MPSNNRKLAAILFADIEGYTSLMQLDEKHALKLLNKFQYTLQLNINNHNGRIINQYGDGCLAIFHSSVDAIQCAKSMQILFQSEPLVPVRIGLHSGEIVLEEGNAFGDAINITSRIESITPAGSILFSEAIQKQIHNQSDLKIKFIDTFEFKNVNIPIKIFSLQADGLVDHSVNLARFNQLEASTKSSINKKWLIIPLFAFCLFAFWLFKNWNAHSEAQNAASSTAVKIAILHFDDSAVDDQYKYLGFGLTEELMTSLIRIKAVKVFSSDQIEHSKSINASPKAIGDQLGADYVLSGSVRASDKKIRINARLLDVAANQYIWSYDEDRAHSDILAVQLAFSNGIVKGLPINLTAEEENLFVEHKTVDPEAFELYLRGNYSANFIPEENVKNSNYLLKAIEIDPDFVLPYARLAEEEWNLAHFGTESPIPHWIKAQQYVEKALSIDSMLPQAWVHKGVIQQNYEWDYEGAEKSFKKAMALSQTTENIDLAVLYMNNGRLDDYLNEINNYREGGGKLLPFMSLFYTHAEMYDSAKVILDMFEDDLDTDWYLNWFYGCYHIAQENYKDAIPYLEQSSNLSRSNIEQLKHLCFAYAKLGEIEKAQSVLQKLYELKEKRYVAPYHFAVALIGMGQIDDGFDELYRAYEEHDFHIRWMYQDVAFFDEAIQNDPRYRDLLSKIKLGHLVPKIPNRLIH